VYGQALEPREFTIAGAQPVFGEAGATQQRKVLGCEIALVDLQLMNDAPQFAVAGFESRDGHGEIHPAELQRRF
jgi:hypothetical protein